MLRVSLGVACVTALVAVGGCQRPQLDLEEMMKPPLRPAELDRLEAFVGRWEGTSEMRAPGSDQVIKGTGVNTVSWEADKWLLVERFEGRLGDEGKMSSLTVWQWDPQIKKYRVVWFDNYGISGAGTVHCDEKTKTWHMEFKNRCPAGETSIGEGRMKFIDKNTLEWAYTEWDCWKMGKFFELQGTGHRK